MKILSLSAKLTLSLLTNLILPGFLTVKAATIKDNFVYLSHDQYAVTYNGASNSDIVGVFDPWYPTADTTTGTFSYTLIDSKNGAYAINSTSGVVTVKNNSKLTAGTDALVVRTTLQGRYQDYKMYVTVKATADCKFVDPTASQNGTGTRTSPYNSWESVTFAPGKAYFQKRGTRWASTITISTSGSRGKEIFLGAYGTGKRPEVSVDSVSTGISVNGSFIRVFEYYLTSNGYGIYKGHGSASSGYNVFTDLMFSDLSFYKNYTNNGQLDLSRTMSVKSYPDYQKWRIKILDVSASGAPNGYGIKVEGGYDVSMENIKTYDNEGWGVSLTWGVYNDTITGLLSYNNLNGAIEMSGKYCALSYSILKGAVGKPVIVVDDPDASDTRIHHCIIKGGGSKGAIVLDAYSTVSEYSGWGFGHDFIIEDNIISGATGENAGIVIYYGTYNVYILRNTIHSCPYAVNIGKNNEGVKNIKIHNNIIHTIANKAIMGTGGDDIEIVNNTIDGIVDLTNTTNEVVRNNYFRSLISASKASNNLDIDTIEVANHFKNFKQFDFNLNSTAKSAINKGSNVGVLLDYFLGARVDGKPDIGACEYRGDNVPATDTNENHSNVVYIDPDSIADNVPTTNIKENHSNVVYIDPDNTADNQINGSIEHPFTTWDNVTWKDGYSYLQKRGTETTAQKILIGANDVILGAYGEGELPKISSETNTSLINSYERSSITIRDLNLHATQSVSCINFLGNAGDSIIIERCVLSAGASAIKIIYGQVLVSKYNTITSNNEGIYSTALNNEIYYNLFKGCRSAVNIMSKSSTANIYNNVFYDNVHSLSISYADLTLYNNIFYMTAPGHTAIHHGEGVLRSNYNIFFPEQSGFVSVNNKPFNSLEQLQKDVKIDEQSFNSDPLFMDIYNENFVLKEKSPAINAGINLNLGIDLAGSAVPLSGATDIGVYEFAGSKKSRIITESEYEMIVYPNPTTGNINLSAEIRQDLLSNHPLSNHAEIRILDISGKTVFSKFFNYQDATSIKDNIDLSGISNGLYLLVLFVADQVIKEKIILNK